MASSSSSSSSSLGPPFALFQDRRDNNKGTENVYIREMVPSSWYLMKFTIMYLETTSSSGAVGGIVESFWKMYEALENQEWANFVLNFQKKKMQTIS